MQQAIIYDKERSIKACVADAWRIVAINWRTYLKCTWTAFLIAAIAQAFLFEMVMQYVCQHFVPALRFMQSGGDAEIGKLISLPNIFTAIYLFLAVVLACIGSYLCEGRIVRIVNKYRVSNAMPPKMPFSFGNKEFMAALRLFAMDALCGIALSLLLAIVAMLSVKVSPWFSVVAPLLYIYIWTFVNIARLRYALAGKPFVASLRFSLRHSLGQMFIVQILTLIPFLILSTILLIPSVIYACGEVASTDSILRGDATTMPAILPFAFFLLNTLCFAVLMLVQSWRTWSLGMRAVKD